MSLAVVDASALGAILFVEPGAEDIARRLEGLRLVAPTLVGYELASVFLKKAERYSGQREDLLARLRAFPRLGVEELQVPPEGAAELAAETGVTAYDAAYLWLARRLDAPLVTLDRALQGAAGRIGLPDSPP